MKFSMTGQEKGDLLIQVTAWAGLTVLSQWLPDTYSWTGCHQSIHFFIALRTFFLH